MGHAGTLDPLASGVLLVCLGRRATREVSRLQELEKEYEGVVRLGIQTDTDDLEGKVVKEKAVPPLTREDVEKAAGEFCGQILQVPPAFSALVVGGRKSYYLARRGKEVRPEARRVWIRSLELVSFAPSRIGLRAVCGKGTYIRALARDLGERLGTCGTLEKLVRTRIGHYGLKQSWTLEALRRLAEENRLDVALIPFP